MEIRFKFSISRMFRSCRARNILDIVREPVFTRRNFHLLYSSSPKPRSIPFICQSKPMKTIINNNEEIYEGRRRRVSEMTLYFPSVDGRKCPPASPVSPLNSLHYKSQKKEKKEEPGKKNKKKKKTTGKETIKRLLTVTSSTDSYEFFGSEGEKEEESETFFSSKSFSSGSSEIRFHPNGGKARRRKVWKRYSNVGFFPVARIPMLVGGKVRESVAVVKSSRDPYGDFGSSMVEMIMEKEIFAAEDLEQLLHCFLSLNATCHHQIIVEVFSEIWQALFHCSF
ncbi:transcription repressor OFP8 [Cinnamomum micranthum f. kanehirae]|uniref:Transcription repressor n=1 Tax=Cinnamomum micranthum f. kanehirae TaxID=337451 RepID=A0A3S3Q2G4_9MAGN|nr:transcription repressor OFP8 [Cinnamomum micranthum f. kanehirae]